MTRASSQTSWRATALAALDAAELARWLEQVPVLERLVFQPPRDSTVVVRYGQPPPRKPVTTIAQLAEVVDSRVGLDAVLAGLDMLALQVLTVALWKGGRIERTDITSSDGWSRDAAASRRMGGALDAAAERLRFLLLSVPDHSSWVQVAPDVAEVFDLPGNTARTGLGAITAPALARMLRAHGVKDVPPTREDREQLLYRIITDAAHVRSIIPELPPVSIMALEHLLGDLAPKYVRDLGGVDAERHRSPGSWGAPAKMPELGPALQPLHDLGFLGINLYNDTVWAWRELGQILNPDLVGTWVVLDPPEPVVLRSDGSHAAHPVAHLERMLGTWGVTPPAALTDGSIGVATIRSMAKKLGAPAGHIGLLTHVAVGLGLLSCDVVGRKGRRRDAPSVYAWSVTSEAGRWMTLPATRRWAQLVNHWLIDTNLVDHEDLPERWTVNQDRGFTLHRQLTLRALMEFEPGTGAEPDRLVPWVVQRWPWTVTHSAVDVVLEACRALGLSPGDGPVGLTAAARQLLDGSLDLDATATATDDGAGAVGSHSLVVQGDHTVIAPPDVDIDTRLFLDRIGVIESDGGARLYRITEASLLVALAGGLEPKDIEAGLASRSRTGVPQSISYLIADVDRKRKLLVLAPAVCVIASPDPALIVAAVRVKAAGLHAIGPNAAVSELTMEKVQRALTAKGIIVTVDQQTPTSIAPLTAGRRPASEVSALSSFVSRARLAAEATALIGSASSEPSS